MMFPPAHGVCARQRLFNTAVKSKNYNFLVVPTTPDMSSRLSSKYIHKTSNKQKKASSQINIAGLLHCFHQPR